ncbi:MAG: hypothetical protein WAN00_10745, partial [Trebonia sp.]
GDRRGEMASWVAWGVLAIVAVLLGLVGTFFSVRTLRWFSVITAAVAVIAITRYGYGLTQPPSSNFANAFTSGADAVIKDLLHVLWLGQPTPPPGRIGRIVVAVLILLGYRALEAWAMRRQAPQLDTSAVGDPADDKDKQHDPLTDELKFRLSAMEVRAPAILPGGSRTNELASIAEATGNSAAGLAGAVIQFFGTIWPNPRRIQLKIRAETGTRVTVELENSRSGSTMSTKTVCAARDDETATMVAGAVARQIFAMDRTTPSWCYGALDGSDLGAWLLARQERVAAGTPGDVQKSREGQIKRMWQAADNGRAAGVVRYELASLLDLYAEDVDALELHALRLNSLRLHAMNRAQYPRFYRGRYRLAMSLEMVSNPAHPPFGAKDTKTTLDDTLKILRQAGLTTRELAGTDVSEPDCDGCCALSVSLRKELLTIAAGELRDIRRQLALWRVVRDTLMHRDERAIWLPHWRPRHRQAFRDGVCVAELLVAIRLKFVERELGDAEPCTDARLKYLKLGMDITSDIAGDTGLIRSLLTDPLADDTARPAAGAPEPTLSDAPDRVRWLPWQCCTASWQAAYNTACMYAAFAGVAPETVARVVAALERAINNPDCEMERAYDWISRDPDFTAVENVQLFGDFRDTQQRRDYPEPFAARVPAPRHGEKAPAALKSVEGA